MTVGGRPCYVLGMTRAQAIAVINSRLADLEKFEDAELLTVAGVLQSMGDRPRPARALSPRECALLEQSKADFAAGRSYSTSEVKAMLDDRLALRGVPRSTE